MQDSIATDSMAEIRMMVTGSRTYGVRIRRSLVLVIRPHRSFALGQNARRGLY